MEEGAQWESLGLALYLIYSFYPQDYTGTAIMYIAPSQCQYGTISSWGPQDKKLLLDTIL